MSTPQKANFGELLSKTILPKVHLIALLVAGIGLVFKYLNLGGSADILQVGFSALAAVYFLSGFSMVTVAPDSKHSPYALIIFKVLYIACAVAVVGFLFYVLQMEGYKEMLMMGCGALGVAVLASVVLAAINPDNMTILKRPLFIGIPLCLLSGYFLYYASTH